MVHCILAGGRFGPVVVVRCTFAMGKTVPEVGSDRLKRIKTNLTIGTTGALEWV